MNQQLHPGHLNQARLAILLRFRDLNTAPGGCENIHQFTDERVAYIDGYFQTALQQLIDDDCIELLREGLFLRLLPLGYDQAQIV